MNFCVFTSVLSKITSILNKFTAYCIVINAGKFAQNAVKSIEYASKFAENNGNFIQNASKSIKYIGKFA